MTEAAPVVERTAPTRGEKPPLPNGWVEHISTRYPDRVYFYNVNTNVSTWKCPVLPPAASKNKAEKKANPQLGRGGEASLPVDVDTGGHSIQGVPYPHQRPNDGGFRHHDQFVGQGTVPQACRDPLHLQSPPRRGSNFVEFPSQGQFSGFQSPPTGKKAQKKRQKERKRLALAQAQETPGGQYVGSESAPAKQWANPQSRGGHPNRWRGQQDGYRQTMPGRGRGMQTNQSRNQAWGRGQQNLNRNRGQRSYGSGKQTSGATRNRRGRSPNAQFSPTGRGRFADLSSLSNSQMRAQNSPNFPSDSEQIDAEFSPYEEEVCSSDPEEGESLSPSLPQDDSSNLPTFATEQETLHLDAPTENDRLSKSPDLPERHSMSFGELPIRPQDTRRVFPSNSGYVSPVEGPADSRKVTNFGDPVLLEQTTPRNPHIRTTLLATPIMSDLIPEDRIIHLRSLPPRPRRQGAASNAIWATRGAASAGIKSRLTWTKPRQMPYDPSQAHTKSEKSRQEVLERFTDFPSPRTVSPNLKTKLSDEVRKSSVRKNFNHKEEFREKDAKPSQTKTDKRKADSQDHDNFPVKKKIISIKNPLKSSKESRQTSTDSQPASTAKQGPRLLSPDLAQKNQEASANNNRRISQFCLSEAVGSPNSDCLNSNSNAKKKVRLKRISIDNITGDNSTSVTVEKSTKSPNSTDASNISQQGSKRDGNNPTELGHIKDPDKIASILSWVNTVQPTTAPSSSPDTTRSTVSAVSALSDLDGSKFKVPQETSTAVSESLQPCQGSLPRDCNDSGYSTSTHPTVVLMSSANATEDGRDIVGMDVDDEQANIQGELEDVRTFVKANPDEKLGDLTKNVCGLMDVDNPSELQSTSNNGTCQLYLVLDTNILLSYLSFVEELRDTSIKGFGRPCLVLPWMVLQELDVLKDKQNKFPNLSCWSRNKARATVHFFHHSITTKHPRVVGQTPEDAKKQWSPLQVECNDDHVLQCCHQWKTKNPHAVVVLVTDDLNLVTKATVCGIRAFTKSNLLKGLKSSSVRDSPEHITPTNQHANVSNVSHTSSNPATPIPPQSQKNSSREATLDINTTVKLRRQSELQLADELFCEMKTCLRDILDFVLETEMKKIYDDLWSEIVLRKPPRTLKDLLECYEKHWIAVFGDIFERKIKDHVLKLLTHFKEGSRYGMNVRQVCCFLDNGIAILEATASMSRYRDEASEPLALLKKLKELGSGVTGGSIQLSDVPDLNVYLERKEETPVKDPPVDPVSPEVDELSSVPSSHTLAQGETDAKIVLDKFTVIWGTINQFCDTVKKQLEAGESVQEQIAQNLLEIKEIRTCFHRALSVKRKEITKNSPAFSALANKLNAPAPNNNASPMVDVDKLMRFFSSKENRVKLQNGMQQLDAMLVTLHNCVLQISPP